MRILAVLAPTRLCRSRFQRGRVSQSTNVVHVASAAADVRPALCDESTVVASPFVVARSDEELAVRHSYCTSTCREATTSDCIPSGARCAATASSSSSSMSQNLFDKHILPFLTPGMTIPIAVIGLHIPRNAEAPLTQRLTVSDWLSTSCAGSHIDVVTGMDDIGAMYVKRSIAAAAAWTPLPFGTLTNDLNDRNRTLAAVPLHCGITYRELLLRLGVLNRETTPTNVNEVTRPLFSILNGFPDDFFTLPDPTFHYIVYRTQEKALSMISGAPRAHVRPEGVSEYIWNARRFISHRETPFPSNRYAGHDLSLCECDAATSIASFHASPPHQDARQASHLHRTAVHLGAQVGKRMHQLRFRLTKSLFTKATKRERRGVLAPVPFAA